MGATPARLALVLFSLAVVALSVSSHRRVTGDGAEYIAMAERLAHFDPPWFSTEIPNQPVPMPVDRYGQRQAWHFSFFPALAVPLLWIFPSRPLVAFTCLNALLLLGAFGCVQRRTGLGAALLVCAGPILWWIDKAQVEVFTVSLLAIGCALLERRGAAAVAFAMASTQNPPIAIVPILLAVERLVRDRRSLYAERRWWMLAFALSVLHPAFYLWRLDRLTPLVPHGDVRIPAIRTSLAVLLDSNIGLVPNAPFTALVLGLCGILAATNRFARKRLAFAAVIAAAFLIAFAQAPNINSGGTVDMSRYALWMIPLAIVVWPASDGAYALVLPALVCASIVWSVLFFRPSIEEQYLRPTRLALWVWTKHPSWENPLPEIFAERLRHQDGVNPLASTPDCAKALIQEGIWPEGCLPVRVPSWCSTPNALCYANRRADNVYSFVETSRRGGIRLR